jgi:hypothetical protein
MGVVTVCSRRSSSWSDLGAVRSKRLPKAALGSQSAAACRQFFTGNRVPHGERLADVVEKMSSQSRSYHVG